VCVFSHDDIEIHAADFRERLLGHLEHCDVAGVAGTTQLAGPAWGWAGPPHVYGQVGVYVAQKNFFDAAIYAAPARHIGDIQALDGVFFACHRRVVESTPFDAETFTGFHHYDLDFTYRAFRAGMKLAVCCDLDLIHFSFGAFGSDAWKASAAAFMRKHGATIPQRPAALWNRTSARVATREQLLPCLRPPHWDTPPASAPG
jgi:GT2 family glycosyltransferase